MQVKIEAFQVAESFNMKKLRAEFRAEVHSGNNSELFYFFETENRYLTIFDYGVVVFANYDETHKSEFIRFVKNYAENTLETEISETYLLETNEKATRSFVKDNVVVVPKVTPSVCRIVMLNVGQSVAFEFYELLTEGLLQSSRKLRRNWN